MEISSRRLGAELILQLEKGFSIKSLEAWANAFYHDNIRNLNPETKYILQDLMSLSLGSEFEMTEEEVWDLAIKLISKNHNKIRTEEKE